MEARSLRCLEPWSCLNNKVVLVTGASSGLGRDFCRDLAQAGCKIIAAARRVHLLNSLCNEINQLRPVDENCDPICRAVAIELDITSPGQVIDDCVAKIWKVFGRVDVLINNAGVRGKLRSSLEISDKEWKQILDTNLMGTWKLSKCIASRMHSTGRGGLIINISSITGLNRVQFHGGVPYNSSKSGIDSMTRAMALELGQYNIRVNGIAPGLFLSEITEALFKQDALDVIKKGIPMGFTCSTNPALTSLVRYLIHESSNYVTGNIFIVDGGISLPGLPIFSSL
ncbi:uncharacterized protein LOC127256747 [Andrographis paniculata]|uniref:uncharacterized protein LOC127256747 n=1 Tax=Andrographis paniculata TaxID=175694 RepID=UPI0021E8F784|nr:uncharacterized protein LOC127256747 [Andrographis paniculata]